MLYVAIRLTNQNMTTSSLSYNHSFNYLINFIMFLRLSIFHKIYCHLILFHCIYIVIILIDVATYILLSNELKFI